MFDLSTPASRLLYSTVMVNAIFANGNTSTGTAFFCMFKIASERTFPILVTNKHVIHGSTNVKLSLHLGVTDQQTDKMKPGSESFEVVLSTDDFIDHPGDVDLCGVPAHLPALFAKRQGKDVFFYPIPDNLFANDDNLEKMSALEDVVMVGYPIGLSDTVNNFPVIRRGITASHPCTDFNGKPVGVVDIASFPGSSGSPVLILNQGGYATGGNFAIGNRVLLLGILYAGPRFRADGTLEIKEIPTGRSGVPVVHIPAHLGFYVKARELHVLKEQIVNIIKPESWSA